MASVPQIRERLKEVFSEVQADVLAQVVVEARDDLVTRADFHELTEVVKELAESQRKTESRVQELAVAQGRTEEGLKELTTAEQQTQQSLKKLATAQEGTEQRLKELATAQERTEQGLERLALAHESLAQSQEELAEAQTELTWAMKDTRKQLGGLAQSVGYGLEAYAMDRIPRILAKQMPFIEEMAGPEQFVSPAGEQDDIDVVVRGTLAGRPVVFLCETKTNISPQEVREFLATVERVRPQVGCDDVRILYFAYRANPEARAAVMATGGYLVFPHTILVRPAA